MSVWDDQDLQGKDKNMWIEIEQSDGEIYMQQRCKPAVAKEPQRGPYVPQGHSPCLIYRGRSESG